VIGAALAAHQAPAPEHCQVARFTVRATCGVTFRRHGRQAGMVCDLCGASDPRWLLLAPGPLTEDPQWLACSPCHQLVVARDHQGLAERAVRRHLEALAPPLGASPDGWGAVVAESVRQTHSAFWRGFEGGAERL
jgi:hypothetical protein